MRNRRQYAFTLIELITVMAITAILMTIITIPMVQTFNATRTAQAYSDAQDKARILTEELSKEIGEAVAVRDVEGVKGRVSIVAPIPTKGIDDTGAVVTTPGGYVKIGMNYTKLDLVLPQKVGQRGPGGGFIDPVTGKEDPTLQSAKGQVQLPLAAGTTIKRYWIGLRDPFKNYNNPYDGLLMTRGGGRDNLFVLYSAEVQPVVMTEVPPGSGNFIPQVNAKFFDATDATNRTPNLDDPDFFLATNAAVGTPVNNDSKAMRIQNWLKVAKVETEMTRYDLIQPQIDKAQRLVKMTNAAGVWSPRITPLVLFRPSHVEGDGVDGEAAAALGSESESADQIGSEVYAGQFSMWSNVVVRSYGSNWNNGGGTAYQVGRTDNANFATFYVDPNTSGIPDTTAGSGIETFDITAYTTAYKSHGYDPNSRYPFTAGLNAANMVSGWLSSANADVYAKFMPFFTNNLTGRLIGSFNNWEVGDVTKDPNASANLFSPLDLNSLNLPQVPAQSTVSSGWVNTDTGLTPSTDTGLATGVFSDSPYWDNTFGRFNINRVFDKIWDDAKYGRNGVPSQLGETGGAHRFIDLRTIPQGDGSMSPLAMFPRAIIVPGSEEIYGPDQNPGPNNGFEVRYHRVNHEPGPNEYRINYANIAEPTPAGYAALGFPTPPAVYDRTSLVSAIFQPRFKVGYVQLCSAPEVPIPATMRIPGTTNDVPGRIRVAYKFQFTAPDDVVRVEYDTRQLMQVIMTIRNYPQSDVPFPQTVTMKATANVRNFIR
ncbi:MAG: prepilin-type N-terminal cleavage/methylation domain-containing protein [Armatimonadetes bacterium]|nr:prepilin-type N-terminal cleavage/methylation domain-containing protein [Armatimonadota bacterium]